MHFPFDCITDFIFVKGNIKPTDIILVPGCSSKHLMEKAAEFYYNGFAPYILPSGGPNKKLPDFNSEWDFFKQTGISLGVPENVILKEDEARNTFENARFSLHVLNDMKFDIKSALLVCKGYHSRRALMTYQTIFPKNVEFYVSTVVDDKGITEDNWYLDENRIKVVMGEVAKIGNYFSIEIPDLYNKYK